MRLDVPYRLVDRLDTGRLVAFVETRLAPLFAPGAPAWEAVAARARFIGAAERPPDVGYRKMRPTGYLQLCVENDEVPPSPWALAIPADVAAAGELAALVAPAVELCRRAYGAGVLHFCVFAVLAPGGEVPRHRDMPHDLNKKAFSHHLHVPLTGQDGAELTVGDTTFRLAPGGAYEIDNLVPHAAANRGAQARVNLMLDWTPEANLARRAAPSPPVPPPGPAAPGPGDPPG